MHEFSLWVAEQHNRDYGKDWHGVSTIVSDGNFGRTVHIGMASDRYVWACAILSVWPRSMHMDTIRIYSISHPRESLYVICMCIDRGTIFHSVCTLVVFRMYAVFGHVCEDLFFGRMLWDRAHNGTRAYRQRYGSICELSTNSIVWIEPDTHHIHTVSHRYGCVNVASIWMCRGRRTCNGDIGRAVRPYGSECVALIYSIPHWRSHTRCTYVVFHVYACISHAEQALQTW